MPAAARALGITELLELVLSHLPIHDLLFAQRVSKTWSLLIKTSGILQESLFFKPRRGTLATGSYLKSSLPKINPVFQNPQNRFRMRIYLPRLDIRPDSVRVTDQMIGDGYCVRYSDVLD